MSCCVFWFGLVRDDLARPSVAHGPENQTSAVVIVTSRSSCWLLKACRLYAVFPLTQAVEEDETAVI